jgi:hypothetical protein
MITSELSTQNFKNRKKKFIKISLIIGHCFNFVMISECGNRFYSDEILKKNFLKIKFVFYIKVFNSECHLVVFLNQEHLQPLVKVKKLIQKMLEKIFFV